MPTIVEYLNNFNITPPVVQTLPLICVGSTIGGLRKVYVAQRSRHGKFWFYEETAKLQYGQITGNQTVGEWQKLFNRIEGAQFSQIQEKSPSRSYNISLTLNFNEMEIVKRDVFEQFVVCNDTMFIVQDYNLKWWLIGESNGCSVEWEATSDDRFGINGDKLIITCKERSPVREVSQTFINLYVEQISDTSICRLSWTETCADTWIDICNLNW